MTVNRRLMRALQLRAIRFPGETSENCGADKKTGRP
jgi:hypothetical protein